VSDPRCVVIIPSFNTGPILRETIADAIGHAAPTPVHVIIDGSTDGSPALLEALVAEHPGQLRVSHLPANSGKGHAVLHGLRAAIEDGFTHILTMDADGQHPSSFIPRFLRQAASHPNAAVFGRPVFDANAPALRVNGRKVSNFWANLETLGWGIDDSLFGMRLYPAQPLLRALASTRFARRFDFDPEVAVRLAWHGVPIINLPTPVRYPSADEGGVSQFRYLRDNSLLTWMHIRLFLGFLLRLPLLLVRGSNPLINLSPPQL
jgi:glycosyltransferase involved in cell wall biosynthesis